MSTNELNLSNDVFCEIESIKNKYEQIMSFIETKDKKIKEQLVDFSNSLEFNKYREFRDAISDMGRDSSGKKKFACYELSAALMNERPRLIA